MSRDIGNVLSLFDGMSCGQQALERSGIKYNKYYASEIDKYAIQVTQHNYPNTIQLGSVVDIDISRLEPIDLLIGGSPCQSFSFAGKRNGMTTTCNEEIYTLDRYLELKSDGFQFEGESYLFWEYMRILTGIRKYNPDVLFLLENVEMGNKWERILSEAIGIYGVHINSALVSAQNRKRIYWTNIRTRENGLFGEMHSDIPQPEDKGILLKDILEDNVDEKYYVSSKSMMNFITDEWRINKSYTQINGEKSLPQMARQYSSWNGDYVYAAMRGREAVLTPKRTEYGKAIRKDYESGKIQEQRKNIQQLDPRQDGKTNTLTSVQKDNLVVQINPDFMLYEGVDFRKNYAVIGDGYEQDNRAYYENGKSGTLDLKSESRQKVLIEKSPCLHGFEHGTNGQLNKQLAEGGLIRRLTPIECERLQTVKDNFTACVSDTQRYKMLGNGWTIDVIAHIFSFI